MNAPTQSQQQGLNRDFATGRAFSENALVINRAGRIVPGARPGWWARVAVACQTTIHHLAPIGYEDETGFSYGGMPISNTAEIREMTTKRRVNGTRKPDRRETHDKTNNIKIESPAMLLRNENSFRLLVESIKDYAIVLLDPGGHVASWNAGAERFKGCRPEEIIGKHFSCFYPPEAIERGLPQRELETAAKDGRFEDEGWRVRKDGKKFRANVIISALREKDGTLRGFSKVTRDLTERKQAEEVLRESEARYRTLVENIPQKIFMKDRNGRWISVNDNFARDFGIRPEDIVGKVNADLFSKEIADKCTADEERVMETGQAAELDERYVQSARETWVHTTKTPVRDKNGGIIGLFGIFWYITERKQAQETIHQLNSELERRVLDRTSQLEAANQELEAFSYSVSHDLRAPLRAVDGFSKIVLEDYGPQLPEGCRQDLQTIRSGAQKMGKLIDELLTFSRLSRLPLSKQAVDTGMMVRGVLEELNSHRNGQRIEFRIADLPTCQADPALLKQV